MNEKKRFHCHYCGRGMISLPGAQPSEALENWLTISHWKGHGVVSHYNFCSFGCLNAWAESRVPRVPEVFIESFRADRAAGN